MLYRTVPILTVNQLITFLVPWYRIISSTVVSRFANADTIFKFSQLLTLSKVFFIKKIKSKSSSSPFVNLRDAYLPLLELHSSPIDGLSNLWLLIMSSNEVDTVPNSREIVGGSNWVYSCDSLFDLPHLNKLDCCGLLWYSWDVYEGKGGYLLRRKKGLYQVFYQVFF
jgi:hypothetical protein